MSTGGCLATPRPGPEPPRPRRPVLPPFSTSSPSICGRDREERTPRVSDERGSSPLPHQHPWAGPGAASSGGEGSWAGGGGCQMADDARPQKEEGKRGPTPPGARWPALASSALWRSSLWAILRPGHRAGWLRRAKVTSSRSEAETAFLGSGNVILGQRAVCPRRGTCDLRLTRSGVMLPVRCLVRAGAGPLQCGTWRRRPLRPGQVLSRDTEEPPPHPDGARPGHGGGCLCHVSPLLLSPSPGPAPSGALHPGA